MIVHAGKVGKVQPLDHEELLENLSMLLERRALLAFAIDTDGVTERRLKAQRTTRQRIIKTCRLIKEAA